MAPPRSVEQLIIHQFDLARPPLGGIETCLHAFCAYGPPEIRLAAVGVDAVGGSRRLGEWEEHSFGGRIVHFMPVVRLQAHRARRVPHSVRLMAGLERFRRQLPPAELYQAHNLVVAVSLLARRRGPLSYFVHTQPGGMTSPTSDSIWRYFDRGYDAVEEAVVSRAERVTVFNPDNAERLASFNPSLRFSPTWYDPAVVRSGAELDRDPHRILWVGRLSTPKDPELALSTFRRLVELDPSRPWSLEIIGDGPLAERLADLHGALAAPLRAVVRLRGRRSHAEVADAMSRGGLFLMTSHPGYEGFPLVLVEAMANGLPAVVTEGSDPGGLVSRGVGSVCGRDPHDLARALVEALSIQRDRVRATVQELRADLVVPDLLSPPSVRGSRR